MDRRHPLQMCGHMVDNKPTLRTRRRVVGAEVQGGHGVVGEVDGVAASLVGGADPHGGLGVRTSRAGVRSRMRERRIPETGGAAQRRYDRWAWAETPAPGGGLLSASVRAPWGLAALFANARVIVGTVLALDGLATLLADLREEQRPVALTDGLAALLANLRVVVGAAVV